MNKGALIWALLPAALAASAAPGASSPLPPFVDEASFSVEDYDGTDDDLLTAGLGQGGLARAEDELAREGKFGLSPAGLRRLAIFRNYKAIVDTSPGGGYGVLFGPDVDATLGRRGNGGKVAGREYKAFVQPEDGIAATAVVQVPVDFDFDAPCIVAAPSSGSRGVYGAISTAEAAFNHRCAVALTDKGTGNGFHDLDGRWLFDIDGKLVRDVPVQFRAGTAGAERPAAAEGGGPRIAFKHAHSGDNPERNWGRYVLLSIEFALWALNDYAAASDWPIGQSFTADNTTVVAAGVSNGGGAVLKAAEQDRERSPLIDVVVASEPQVQPVYEPRIKIDDRGSRVARHSRSLFDVVTFMNLHAPCAAVAAVPDEVKLGVLEEEYGERWTQRCQDLHLQRRIEAKDTEEQAAEALEAIHRHGLLPDADYLLQAHESLGLWRLLAATYANAYARASVDDDLCSIGFAAVDEQGNPRRIMVEELQQLFAQTGLPESAGMNIHIIDQKAPGGPKWERLTEDLGLRAALCFRDTMKHPSVRAGIREVQATGDLQGKPAIILHGRNDALIPPNHTSRPYYALARIAHGSRDARYIEVPHANHFDALNTSLFGARDIPLHYYFNQAISAAMDHERRNAPLPDSQVLATKPRGGAALTADNYREHLPDLMAKADKSRAIEIRGETLVIPRDKTMN